MYEEEKADGDEVRTIRVVNVPSHATLTEFHCWFLFADGFEQATLRPSRGPGQSQLGWARFSTRATAQAAIEHLNGRQLSADQSHERTILEAGFAKNNFTRSLRSDSMDAAAPGIYAQSMRAQPLPEQHIPAPPVPRAQQQRPPPRVQHVQHLAPVGSYSGAGALNGSGRSSAPCSTLFLGGLWPGNEVTESELHDFLTGQCEGFERLKFVSTTGEKPGMAFAKFATPPHAEAALNTIVAGWTLQSNPSTPLQAEFAKNDLDHKSDGATSAPWRVPAPVPVPPPRREVPPPPPPKPVTQGPCDTMFVGGLHEWVSQNDLEEFFATLPGYVRMKLVGEGQPKPGPAFVLFESSSSCADAIAIVSGTALPKYPDQALNCTYAKNSLDKRQRTT